MRCWGRGIARDRRARCGSGRHDLRTADTRTASARSYRHWFSVVCNGFTSGGRARLSRLRLLWLSVSSIRNIDPSAADPLRHGARRPVMVVRKKSADTGLRRHDGGMRPKLTITPPGRFFLRKPHVLGRMSGGIIQDFDLYCPSRPPRTRKVDVGIGRTRLAFFDLNSHLSGFRKGTCMLPINSVSVVYLMIP
jgi:hypothetical protein